MFIFIDFFLVKNSPILENSGFVVLELVVAYDEQYKVVPKYVYI